MNAPTVNGVARAASIALVVILAAAVGLAVGNLIQQVNDERSITAQASFSREALDDLQAIREDRPAAAAYPDYAIRHAPAAANYPDWAIRHPATAAGAAEMTDTFRLAGPSDVEASDAATTDTFRLTGPSDSDTEMRSQVKPN